MELAIASIIVCVNLLYYFYVSILYYLVVLTKYDHYKVVKYLVYKIYGLFNTDIY